MDKKWINQGRNRWRLDPVFVIWTGHRCNGDSCLRRLALRSRSPFLGMHLHSYISLNPNFELLPRGIGNPLGYVALQRENIFFRCRRANCTKNMYRILAEHLGICFGHERNFLLFLTCLSIFIFYASSLTFNHKKKKIQHRAVTLIGGIWLSQDILHSGTEECFLMASIQRW